MIFFIIRSINEEFDKNVGIAFGEIVHDRVNVWQNSAYLSL